MRNLWKHSLVLACSGLMLAAPLPVFSQPLIAQLAVTLSVTPPSPTAIGTQLTLTAQATGGLPVTSITSKHYSFSAVLSPSGQSYQIYAGTSSHVTWTPPNARYHQKVCK